MKTQAAIFEAYIAGVICGSRDSGGKHEMDQDPSLWLDRTFLPLAWWAVERLQCFERGESWDEDRDATTGHTVANVHRTGLNASGGQETAGGSLELMLADLALQTPLAATAPPSPIELDDLSLGAPMLLNEMTQRLEIEPQTYRALKESRWGFDHWEMECRVLGPRGQIW
jgi:hypothetical protein